MLCLGDIMMAVAEVLSDRSEVRGDDFARRVVPTEARTTAVSVGVMLLAANISLPVLVVGGQLGIARGFEGTARAAIWGGRELAGLAGACGYAGARSRLSTYLLIVRAFGERGGSWISLLLAICAIGWFGVVLRLFADTMVRLAAGPIAIWAMLGTGLMAYTAVVGFRALTRLSNVMLPAKLVLLVWAVWAALRAHGTSLFGPPHAPGLLEDRGAISFVVGGWVVGAVVAPDFTRYARSAVGGALATAAALGVGYPLILVASAVPAIVSGNGDLLATMAALGLGLAALGIILLSSWANGALNLYSGSLMLAVVFRRRERRSLIWVAAAIGLVMGVAGIAERLIPYLTLLGLVIPSIAGVYLPRFLLEERRGAELATAHWRPAAVAALVIGIAVATATKLTGSALTGIDAVDSLVISAGAYLLLEGVGALGRRESPRSV